MNNNNKHTNTDTNNETASSHAASIWPLYLFSFFHVLGIAVLFGDLCNYMTGNPCHDAENVAAKSFGITVACTGVLYFVLVYLAKSSSQPAKLQRLATFATHAMALIMAGVVFTAGKEPQSNHIGDMVGGMAVFLLLLFYYHPVQDGTTPTPIGPTSPCTGLGLNPKTVVLIIAIVLVVKIFLVVDFWDPSYFLINPEMATEFASFLWQWVAIYMLEILLATIYVLLYGDVRDQEVYLITVVVLSILTGLAMIPICNNQIKASLLRQAMISGIMFFLICIAAIIGGRHRSSQQHHGGYKSVSPNHH